MFGDSGSVGVSGERHTGGAERSAGRDTVRGRTVRLRGMVGRQVLVTDGGVCFAVHSVLSSELPSQQTSQQQI